MPESEKKKAELKISGMTCATCAVNIEDSLSKIKDVSKAQVNFGTDTAQVEFDPKKVTLAELENAVKQAGYETINREATIKGLRNMCPDHRSSTSCTSRCHKRFSKPRY